VFWNPRSNRPNKEAFQKFLEAASEIFLVSPRANLFREPVFSLSGNAERRERIRRRNFLREIGVGFWDSFRGYLGGLKAPQLRTRFRPFVIGAGLPAPRLQVRACEPFNAAFYIVAMAAFCLFLDRPAPFVIFYLKINNMIEIVNDRKFIITCGNETVDDCTKTREIMNNIVINGDERVMIASVTLGVVLATIVMFQLVCGILVKAAASIIPFAIRLINLRPGARGR
jgi:hypothetical protein